MPATTMRWCPSCQEWFTPDRYNAWHQHYCSKSLCRLNIADIQRTHRLTHPRERDEMSRDEGDPQPQPQ